MDIVALTLVAFKGRITIFPSFVSGMVASTLHLDPNRTVHLRTDPRPKTLPRVSRGYVFLCLPADLHRQPSRNHTSTPFVLQGGKERSPAVQGDNSIKSLPISIPLSTVHPSKLPVSIPLASVVLPSRAERLVRALTHTATTELQSCTWTRHGTGCTRLTLTGKEGLLVPTGLIVSYQGCKS